MDDSDYREKALRKISHYASEGIVLGVNLIATFETSATPLDVQLVETYINTLIPQVSQGGYAQGD